MLKIVGISLFGVLSIIWFNHCWAQPNMVSNGGFEVLESAHVPEHVTLEEGCGSTGAYVFYDNHTIGSVYQLGVPSNMYGSQEPHAGGKYGGVIRKYYYTGGQTGCERGGQIIFHLNEPIYKGYHYTLKFFTSHMDDSDDDAQLEVTLDNDQSVFDYSISDKTNWQQKTVTFTADDDYEDLMFEVTNSMLFTSNLTGVYIDDVSMSLTCMVADPCRGLNPVISPIFSSNPITQTTAFKIDNLENVQICSVIIRDFLTQIVHFKTVECETGINQPLYWKGVNNSGSSVANGVYTYEILLTNDCGSRTYSGTIVKNASFTGSVSEFACDPNGYNAPQLCCEYEPNLLLDNLHSINQELIFHSTSEIIVASSNPVTVGSGSDVIMRAGERIEMNPGFSTDNAESFVAEIVPCPELRIVDSDIVISEEDHSIGTDDALSGTDKDRLIIYPNPNAGAFTIAGPPMIWIEVLEPLGKSLKQLSCNMATHVQIDGLSAGLYLIRVQLARGNYEITKVVVQ